MEKKTLCAPGPTPAQPRPAPRRPQRRQETLYNTNERIRAREVRLVGDNVSPASTPFRKPSARAEELELDLIRDLAHCRSRRSARYLTTRSFLYQQKKRQKERRPKATKVVVKEYASARRPSDHDYNFKLKHAIGFASGKAPR